MPSPNDPRHQAQDVTAQFTKSVPQMLTIAEIPADIMAESIMGGVEQRMWQGRPTEKEAREMVTKTFRIPRVTDILLNDIAQDERFGFDHRVSDVIRLGVQCLIEYLQNKEGLLKENEGYANELLATQMSLRLDAERARRRKEFREDVGSFDEEMREARKIGDFEYIADRLTKYSDILKGCISTVQYQVLVETLARSIETRAAVSAFYDWMMDPGAVRANAAGFDEGKWTALARAWQAFFEDV